MAGRKTSPLGEFIRRNRELSEYSMRQFAELAGISNPYLSQIERGLRAPSEQVVQSIADVLKVSADTLYEQAGVTRDGDEASDTVAAIEEDPRLTPRQRRAMLEIYESFTGISARPRRRRRTEPDAASGSQTKR
ncbi:MAG TPA: helix-turn-helix transcriptional regulator [Solirubrobacteraceae bacterium]